MNNGDNRRLKNVCRFFLHKTSWKNQFHSKKVSYIQRRRRKLNLKWARQAQAIFPFDHTIGWAEDRTRETAIKIPSQLGWRGKRLGNPESVSVYVLRQEDIKRRQWRRWLTRMDCRPTGQLDCRPINAICFKKRRSQIGLSPFFASDAKRALI